MRNKIRLRGIFKIYLSKLNFQSLYFNFLELDPQYRYEFWDFFEKYGLYKRFCKDEFLKLLNVSPNSIRAILKNFKTVKHYDNTIHDHLLDMPIAAEIFLDKYVVEPMFTGNQIHLPPSISKQDIEQCIKVYINSEHTTINYLKLILNTKNDILRINDRTRLAASRKQEILEKEFFEKSNSMELGISVEL